MGAVTVAGGMVGALLGALIFNLLRAMGQIDVVINVLYVVMLGTIGGLMARESVESLRNRAPGKKKSAAKRRHHPMIASLPYRWRFYKSGLYISPLGPLILGVVVGILTMLMGVGGGFFMVPAMLYVLGMSAKVVVGTSLFNILFITMLVTMVHAFTTRAVDIVLAGLLLVGSVTGAQLGTKIAAFAKPEHLRLVLAMIVLAIALRMAFNLGVRPDEVYTVVPL
jgi:uncharacterized membrane protein YfcA